MLKQLRQAVRGLRLRAHPLFRDIDGKISTIRLVNIDSCSRISNQKKFFYSRIPKAANSTVMATLVHSDNGFRAVSRGDIKRAKSYYPPASAIHLDRQTLISEYFKFTVVRHPFARIVSAFNDKIIDASGYQEVVRGRRMVVFQGGLDDVLEIFEDFLVRLKGGLMLNNYHFMPQTSLMLFRPEELDYIGKVETIESDLNVITRHVFGASKEIVTWAPHAAQNGIRPRGQSMKAELLTKHQKLLLAKLYRQDFELLGYEPT